MNQIINNLISVINEIGGGFCSFAGSMFIQSSLLILLLLIINFLIKKHVRATFRYWIWMLVFIKLVLPPTLSSPTGVGNLAGDYFTTDSFVSEQQFDIEHNEPVIASIIQQSPEPVEIPAVQTAPALSGPISSVEHTVPVVSAEAGLNSLSLQGVVFMLWLVGVLVITVLLFQRVLFVRGLIAQSEPARGRLVNILNLCREQVGVRRNIHLRLSHNLTSPAVCGLFRPVILVPKNLLEKLSQDKLKAVLIHELAHVKRGDLWINCLQTFLQIAYFYNPFVWLANTIVRRIREQAVDEMVLVALGTQAENYSNTLIDIAEMAFSRPALSLRLVGVVESKKALSHRIKHILGRPFPKSAKLGIVGLLAIIVTAAVLLPMAKADKKNNTAEPEQDSKKYTATLPNGVIVELLGICEYEGRSKDWWRPDGTRFSPDYKIQEYEKFNGQNRLGFAVKLNTDNFKLRYEIEGTGSYSGMDVYDSNKEKLNNSKATVIRLDDNREATTVHLGISTGQWQTIAEYHGGRDFTDNKDVVFSEPIESKHGTTIAVRGEWGFDGERQIIAIDEKGDIHTGGWRGRSTGLKTLATTEFYDLKPAQIQKYQLQFRPYEWATFKNVSLRPDMKTDVQIETADNIENSILRSDQNEKIIGSIKEINGNVGRITSEHGDAIYGNDIRYTPSLYLGRVRRGAQVQLINSNVINNQYRIPIIKIKTISECPDVPAGTIGWIKLKNTSFKDNFIVHENIRPAQHSYAAKMEEQDKAKIILRANVFSVNAPVSLITDYLRDEFGVNNTASRMTDTQVAKLKKWMGTVPETTMISSPSVLVFDGETAEMSVITNERFYTADYEKTSDSPPQYKPVLKNFSTGIELEFTPALTKDKNIIHLNMKFNKNDLIKFEEKKHESGNMIQLPMLTNSEITTQVAVPVGKYFLVSVAGMYPAKNSTQSDQMSNQIILLVKADIQDKAEQSNEKVPAGMVGTWFFDNPMGDEEQMAIFPDGRVVVLYSNGHKDQCRYENGCIELAEYDNARFKITRLENGSLVQYHLDTNAGGLAKRWRRIDPEPQTKLLRSLTEGDYEKSNAR